MSCGMSQNIFDRFMRVHRTKFLTIGAIALPVFALSVALMIATTFENGLSVLALVCAVSGAFTALGLGCLIDSLKRPSQEELD